MKSAKQSRNLRVASGKRCAVHSAHRGVTFKISGHVLAPQPSGLLVGETLVPVSSLRPGDY
jgi:hypothetical protein